MTPGRLALETECGIRESDWKGVHWVKWNDAVREAGLEPNKMQEAYASDHLLGLLAQLSKEIGHIPTEADLRMKARKAPGFPNGKTFGRLGSKPERIGLLLDFCQKHSEYAEVVSLCDSALASLPEIQDDELTSTEKEGVVYLIRSGRHFKIGFTYDLERRESALAYQTVHKNVKVHSFRTDDPSGIEAYWHKRFADKRVRSDAEWFALNAKDVTAFRRRKRFM